MTVFDAIILGIVEGITEYLPVSSTAHLYLAGQMLGLKQDSFLTAFEIIIQIAPIFSVMIIYRDRLIQSRALWVKLILSFIPTGVVGLLFHKQIEAMFEANSTVALMLLTGIAFLAVEYTYKPREHHVKAIEEVSIKQALIVGIYQVFALVPGISRSGITILGGMLTGLSRDTAMAFSFLLAIPTMTAASGYMLYKSRDTLSLDHVGALSVGFVVSFIVSWVAVKTFLAIVSRYSFKPFGIYLIVSALLYGLFGIDLAH
jgi:undecaprenyl-diphosphatase